MYSWFPAKKDGFYLCQDKAYERWETNEGPRGNEQLKNESGEEEIERNIPKQTERESVPWGGISVRLPVIEAKHLRISQEEEKFI